MDGCAGVKPIAMLCVMVFLGGCGCALDSGEKKDSSYIGGCWDHLWQDKEAKEGKF